MNLSKLFEIQATLDKRIVEKHNLQGQDLLPKKILALQVELGELANEARFFKFWSEDQEPRNKIPSFDEKGLLVFDNPLLEEYVDCLHFILSIGLDIGLTRDYVDGLTELTESDILTQFRKIQHYITLLDGAIEHQRNISTMQWYYYHPFSLFIGLGEMLGFTWEEIEAAYMDKNKVNHERQDDGY
jgi:dimeric dUTPase (all-alpha-NTP-PPase superfamily)